METCAAATDAALVEGLLTSVDCHIGALVQTGYGAIAGQDSFLAAALTSVLTLYIAVLGLRLMLGLGALRVGDLTLAAVKIGVILALASNWPLYHRLVFETLFHGPEQLAGELLMGSAQARPIDALHGALQFAFDEMQASAQFYAEKTPGGVSPWVGGSGFSAAALTLSSVLMLVSTLGVLLGLRIVLAALLVAGPIFLGFFLFPSTRGVFLGWLRASLGLSFAPLFAVLALVMELRLVQPHLAALAAVRAQGATDTGPAVAVLVITLTTATVMLAGLAAAAALGLSLRLPSGRSRPTENPAAAPAQPIQLVADRATPAAPHLLEAPRIASVAAAAAALERRDSRLQIEREIRGGSVGASALAGAAAPEGGMSAGLRRAAQPPRAASSLRRDG